MKKIIEVKNIGKQYTIGEREKYLAIRDIIVKGAKVPLNLLKGKKFVKKEKFWALKDVSFSVNKGEVVGVIGKNGSGKSTLLKILSRITEPSEGEAVLYGKVSSLLEVGTGFHPELTGRENIYLNGAILGMTQKEIDSKFDDIVNFSGVREFLDVPVKRFSSGMQVRLAFSVAAHLDPDILFIDEVLAVGDAEFQKKCLGKMDEVTKKKGRTIIFVSHDMGAVQKLCAKTILLDKGKIIKYGKTEDVISYYMTGINKGGKNFSFQNDINKSAKIIKVDVLTDEKSNEDYNIVDHDKEFSLDIEYQVNRNDSVIHSAVIVDNSQGVRILASASSDNNMDELKPKKKGLYKSRFVFPKTQGIHLDPGVYWFRVSIGSPNDRPIDSVSNIPISIRLPELESKVIDVPNRMSIVNIEGEWITESASK